jgi:hypothetical protein
MDNEYRKTRKYIKNNKGIRNRKSCIREGQKAKLQERRKPPKKKKIKHK